MNKKFYAAILAAISILMLGKNVVAMMEENVVYPIMNNSAPQSPEMSEGNKSKTSITHVNVLSGLGLGGGKKKVDLGKVYSHFEDRLKEEKQNILFGAHEHIKGNFTKTETKINALSKKTDSLESQFSAICDKLNKTNQTLNLYRKSHHELSLTRKILTAVFVLFALERTDKFMRATNDFMRMVNLLFTVSFVYFGNRIWPYITPESVDNTEKEGEK